MEHDKNSGVHRRPLGLLKEMVERAGAEVSYVYDDLVFIRHNHFLLQFGRKTETIHFYANEEIGLEEAKACFGQLQKLSEDFGLTLLFCGSYSLTANDDDTISIAFEKAGE